MYMPTGFVQSYVYAYFKVNLTGIEPAISVVHFKGAESRKNGYKFLDTLANWFGIVKLVHKISQILTFSWHTEMELDRNGWNEVGRKTISNMRIGNHLIGFTSSRQTIPFPFHRHYYLHLRITSWLFQEKLVVHEHARQAWHSFIHSFVFMVIFIAIHSNFRPATKRTLNSYTTVYRSLLTYDVLRSYCFRIPRAVKNGAPFRILIRSAHTHIKPSISIMGVDN